MFRVVFFVVIIIRKLGNRYVYILLFFLFLQYVNLSYIFECFFDDRKFFLDVVFMIGILVFVIMLIKMIIDNEVIGIEVDMWMIILVFIFSLLKDMIREVMVRLVNVVDKVVLFF